MELSGIFDTMKSVKIDEALIDRIKEHVKTTGQTISGCINIAMTEYLDEKEGERVLCDYVNKMAPVLGKAINGTRKNKRK